MPGQRLAGLALARAELAGVGLVTAVRAAGLRLVGADQPCGRGHREQPRDHDHPDDGHPAVRPPAAGEPGVFRPPLVVGVGADPDQPQRLAIPGTAWGRCRLRPGRAIPGLRCARVRRGMAGGAPSPARLVGVGLVGVGLLGARRGGAGLVGAGLVGDGVISSDVLHGARPCGGLVADGLLHVGDPRGRLLYRPGGGLVRDGLLGNGLVRSSPVRGGLPCAGLVRADLLRESLVCGGLLHEGLLRGGLIRDGVVGAGVVRDGLLRAGIVLGVRAEALCRGGGGRILGRNCPGRGRPPGAGWAGGTSAESASATPTCAGMTGEEPGRSGSSGAASPGGVSGGRAWPGPWPGLTCTAVAWPVPAWPVPAVPASAPVTSALLASAPVASAVLVSDSPAPAGRSGAELICTPHRVQ